MASLEEFSIHVNDVEKCMEYYMKIPDAKLEFHIPKQIVKIRIGRNVLQLVKVDLQPPFHIEIETDDLDGIYETFKNEKFQLTNQKRSSGDREHFSRVIQRVTTLSSRVKESNSIGEYTSKFQRLLKILGVSRNRYRSLQRGVKAVSIITQLQPYFSEQNMQTI